MLEVKVTLKKSLIGAGRKQKEAVRCLGLRKIGRHRVFKDTLALRGQIKLARRLLAVESVTSKKGKEGGGL